MEVKQCIGCGEVKPLTEYYERSSRCKPCRKIYKLNYNKNNKEKIKNYYLDNKIKLKEYSQNRYKNNKDYHTQWMKEWRSNNKEKQQKLNKAWKEANPEYSAEYYQKNKEKIFQNIQDWETKNPHIRRWRNLLSNTLNFDKTDSTEHLLGYNATQLREHLDKQGMDWDKHQIDHKIPVSWFKKDTPPHIVNDLRNLQPLEASENQIKSNKFGDLIPLSYIYDIEKHVKKQYKLKLWQRAL